jgi:trehalose/maltose transport system substrate-binding protein
MSRRVIATTMSVVAVISFLAISAPASAVGNAQPRIGIAAKIAAAPHDPYAKTDKKYHGQTITFYGDDPGIGHELDLLAAKRFKADTGITVNVKSKGGANAYANFQTLLQSGSASLDALMMDVLWPGSFQPYLVDLKHVAPQNAKLDYKSIVANDTVKGKMVAIPLTADFGLLYYRKDLLKKYRFHHPPLTWSDLGKMAATIQKGEQKHNSKFYGFAYQGNANETLTANALEWIASFGGGTIITNGKVTVNNTRTTAALNLMKGWVGKITPPAVTTFNENDTKALFDSGNVAFVRHWPSLYPAALSSPALKGKFAVAPLPHQGSGKSTATVAGWELGVSKSSKHKSAAEAFVRYYSSQPMELWRAVQGGFVPVMPSLNSMKAVQKAEPFLKVNTARVMRPSNALGPNYYQGSAYIYSAVHSILTGGNTKANLSQLQVQLESLLKH